MLKRKNKIIVLLSGILLLVIICGFGVFAKNTSTLGVTWVEEVYYHTKGMNIDFSPMVKLTMDDSVAYCVEPRIAVPLEGKEEERKNYVGTTNPSFPVAKLREMELISFYGYGYPGHGSEMYYLAAQELIWELLGTPNTYYSAKDKNKVIDVTDYKNKIKKLIAENSELPSFNGKTIQTKLGAKLSLDDTNNVLSGFTKVVTSNSNVKATINGNTLSIAIGNSNSIPDKVTIKLTKPSVDGRIYKEYSNGKFQKVVSAGSVEGGDSSGLISEVYLEIQGGIPTPPNCTDNPETKKTTCGSSTSFSKGECSVDSNTYYDIKCSETLNVNGLNNNKNISIKAGEGFAYDMNIGGNRTCKGTFNHISWNDDWVSTNITIGKEHNEYVRLYNKTREGCGGTFDYELDTYDCKEGTGIFDEEKGIWVQCIRDYDTEKRCNNYHDLTPKDYNDLVGERNAAKIRRNEAVNKKDNLTNIKSRFDNWTNDYNFEPKLKINIEEGNISTNIDMVEDITSSNNNHNNDSKNTPPKVNYSLYICTFSDYNNADCRFGAKQESFYSSWERTSSVEAVYTLPHKYIKKDSQATVTETKCQNCLDGGYKYYTSFDTPSGTYDIKVTAENLGHKGLWKVNESCFYELNNLMRPEKPDPNYGNTFLYRPISLFTPFPNRIAGYNWLGREHLITDNASNLYNETPEFVVNLSPEAIKNIKADNASKKVGNKSEVYTEYVNNSPIFDPKKPYKSKFIWTTFNELFNIKGGN